MALSITFAGNVYDSSGTLLDYFNAPYQLYVFNSNNQLTKWSDVRYLEAGSYNINAGDPDLSSQDNTLSLNDTAGEYVLIAVWNNSSLRTDTSNPPSELAYIYTELSGQEVYVQDIQLGVVPVIDCSNWTLPNEGFIPDTIIATNNNTNEIEYTAFNKLHYIHKLSSIPGNQEVVFPFIGPSTVLYDFGEGYSESNIFTLSTSGDLLVKIQVQDYYNNTKECSKTIKVYNNVSPCFDWNPSSPITGDTIDITSCVQETYSSIYYIINGVLVQEPASWTIDSYGTISITQVVNYFDGYQDTSKELTKTFITENIPPELNLEVTKITDNEYQFKANPSDTDGTVESIKWEIYRNNPDSEGNDNWSLFYSTGVINDLSDFIYNFTGELGQFKLIATVYDNLGASASQEYLLENLCKTTADQYFENIDWTKNIIKINFNSKVIKNTFKQNVIIIPFGYKIIKRNFFINIIKVPVVNLIHKINFKYKINKVG